MSQFHLFWTIALMIIFVGIFVWAWSGKREQDFEEASRLPLEHDDEADFTQRNKDRGNARHV